ncbi:hypothetical protein SNEBB_000283 [Seison nebaliae]|nr:hypothetical protein SNEBB_000283 [Seison nebaliae]
MVLPRASYRLSQAAWKKGNFMNWAWNTYPEHVVILAGSFLFFGLAYGKDRFFKTDKDIVLAYNHRYTVRRPNEVDDVLKKYCN